MCEPALILIVVFTYVDCIVFWKGAQTFLGVLAAGAYSHIVDLASFMFWLAQLQRMKAIEMLWSIVAWLQVAAYWGGVFDRCDAGPMSLP